MTTPLEVSLASIVGDPARVSTVPQVVNRLSRDFYWYSPVLRKQLDGKTADVVVHPLTVREIQDVLGFCYANGITVRLCPSMEVCFSISRAWTRLNQSPTMELRSSSQVCAWGCSKAKRARW